MALNSYNTNQFRLNKDGKTFITNKSFIGFFPRRINNRIMREVLELKSAKTDAKTIWRLIFTKKDSEGNIKYWKFIPTETTLKENKSLFGYCLIINNI